MKNSNSSTLSLLNTIKFFAFDFKSLVYISQLSETNIHHSSSFIHYIYSNNLSLESKIIFKNSVAKSKKSTIESFASEIGGLEIEYSTKEIESEGREIECSTQEIESEDREIECSTQEIESEGREIDSQITEYHNIRQINKNQI